MEMVMEMEEDGDGGRWRWREEKEGIAFQSRLAIYVEGLFPFWFLLLFSESAVNFI